MKFPHFVLASLFIVYSLLTEAKSQEMDRFQQTQSAVLSSVVKMAKRNKTVGAFVNESSKILNEKDRQFLSEKVKGGENLPFEVETISKDKILIRLNDSVLPIRILENNGKGTLPFEVNNHHIDYDPAKPIE